MKAINNIDELNAFCDKASDIICEPNKITIGGIKPYFGVRFDDNRKEYDIVEVTLHDDFDFYDKIVVASGSPFPISKDEIIKGVISEFEKVKNSIDATIEKLNKL